MPREYKPPKEWFEEMLVAVTADANIPEHLFGPLNVLRMQTEYRFAHGRMWRFDYAWPYLKFAIEIQGGGFYRMGNTGHTNVAGIKRDREKTNAAILLDWTLLLLGNEHFQSKKQRKITRELFLDGLNTAVRRQITNNKADHGCADANCRACCSDWYSSKLVEPVVSRRNDVPRIKRLPGFHG